MNTLKKIDHFIKNIDPEHLICPMCSGCMIIENRSIICENKHTFDINKKGFVKLLKVFKPYNEKIYNEDLFVKRRFVIMGGLYDYLHDKIINILKRLRKPIFNVLDLGCGEGSHAQKLSKKFEYKKFYIVDLNTKAIEMATDYVENLIPIVCDAYNLPFKKSFDVVFDILSPFNYKEIYRILQDDGLFIKVVPTINYLKEIREINGIDDYQNEVAVYENFKSHFNIIQDEVVEKKFELTEEMAKNVINMTPLTDKLTIKKNVDKVTLSLRILVGEKK